MKQLSMFAPVKASDYAQAARDLAAMFMESQRGLPGYATGFRVHVEIDGERYWVQMMREPETVLNICPSCGCNFETFKEQ